MFYVAQELLGELLWFCLNIFSFYCDLVLILLSDEIRREARVFPDIIVLNMERPPIPSSSLTSYGDNF